MQTNARDALQDSGSNDEASCPICGTDINGFEATAHGTRNAACGHAIGKRASELSYGGVADV